MQRLTEKIEDAIERVAHIREEDCDKQVLYTLQGIMETIAEMADKIADTRRRL